MEGDGATLPGPPAGGVGGVFCTGTYDPGTLPIVIDSESFQRYTEEKPAAEDLRYEDNPERSPQADGDPAVVILQGPCFESCRYERASKSKLPMNHRVNNR